MSAPHPYAALLGPTVEGKSGAVDVSSFGSKILGLYFSAHWCPPCRRFTPLLAKFYREFQVSHPGQLEIVFVSSDREESAYNEYYTEMPWLRLAYSDRARKAALSSAYKVNGIPCFILLDPSGETITAKGVEKVMGDSSGASFPWRPRPLGDALASASFVNLLNSPVPAASVLGAGHLMFYFSAHWCPPCRAFTPKLIKWYTEKKAAGLDAEIIFVSGDKSAAEFAEYHGGMPWPAVSFTDKATVATLNDAFEVEGIPTLVVTTRDGRVLTKDGVSRVSAEPDGFPWPPKPCELLEVAVNDINEVKTAVLFVDKLTDDAALVEVTTNFRAVAEERWDGGKAAGDDTIRFAIAEDSEVTSSVRNFAGIARDRDGPTAVRFIVFNIAGGSKYVWPGAGIPSLADIRTFIAAVASGTATATPVRS